MTKQQALDFIAAINDAQPFVPPILFWPIINSQVARLALAVANGGVICDVRDSTAPKPDAHAGNGAAASM